MNFFTLEFKVQQNPQSTGYLGIWGKEYAPVNRGAQ